MENMLEQAKDGFFVSLKCIRTMPYIYPTTDKEVLGVKKFENLFYMKTTNNFIEIANDKLELLGILYYYKKWKRYVWEQNSDIMMAMDCLERVKGICKDVIDFDNIAYEK